MYNDIYDEFLDFVKGVEVDLLIFSKNFNVTLYQNPVIDGNIKELLRNNKNISIYYAKPEKMEKIFKYMSESYSNFTHAMVNQECDFPDLVIKDRKEMLIFNTDRDKTSIMSDERAIEFTLKKINNSILTLC